MAKKRIKREDILDHIEDIVQPYIGQLTEDGPVHIITEKATVPKSSSFTEHYQVTACNRVTKWPSRVVRIKDYDQCSRCGSPEDFERTWNEQQEYSRQRQAERDRQVAMERAEAEANRSWDLLGEMIEAGIESEIENLAASDHILVPLNQDEIRRLKTLVYRDIQQTFGGVTDIGIPRRAKTLYQKLRDYCG